MRLIIAGDFCPHDRVTEMVQTGGGIISSGVSEIIRAADYSIVNFECPVADNNFQPILKKGPNLSCPAEAIQVLANAGFKCVTLANNHFRDYGNQGCKRTIFELSKREIEYMGGGDNLEDAQKVFYKTINDRTLGFVNICESEFSIATSQRAGSAPIDLIENYNQILEARRKADKVIVIVHGGHEHLQLPSPRMKKYYHWYVDIGADVVVNHHQHCYSGYEIYKGKPIFYGIGNFCFDWNGKRNSPWNYGYLVELNIGKEMSFEIYPYLQCNNTPTVESLYGDEYDKVIKDIRQLNKIIIDDTLLQESINKFYLGSMKDSEIMLGNQSENKVIRYLKRHGVISSQMSKTKLVLLQDYIFCESHREKVEFLLNKNI